MSLADVATLGTAIFAAIAAGASWATVAQARRGRIDAATPSMSIDVITPLGSNEVRVHLMNHGHAVRGVEFAVAVDGQMTFSVTPRPTLQPGELLCAGDGRVQTGPATGPFRPPRDRRLRLAVG